MSLTVSPRATMRSASASGSATASSARACPAEIWPPASRARVCSGRLVSRDGVGDMAAALADDAGDVAVRIAVVRAELGVARGFLERVEIGALDILDDGDFERFAVAGLDDDDRDIVAPRPLRRPPAALAGDDLVGVGDAGNWADDDRLDDPALLDRGGELVEFGVVEPLARVARIGPQELDRQPSRAALRTRRLLRSRPRAGRRGRAPGGAVVRFGSGLRPFLLLLATCHSRERGNPGSPR